MKNHTIVRTVAILGLLAIIMGALLPTLGALNY